MNNSLKRFEIWFAELPSITDSHVQQGVRPVLVVSNNKANTYSSVVTVVPFTTKDKPKLPTHVPLLGHGLPRSSTALCEQILSVDKARLTHRVGYVASPPVQSAIHRALAVQLSLVA